MAIPLSEPSLKGYPKLATLMGEFPDVAIFRRFGTLTMLNLLRLQAELVEIEENLRTKQLQDDVVGQATEKYSTIFSILNKSSPSKKGDKDHPNQMALLESSREKLAEYHKLLHTAAQVTQLRKPEERRMRFLRRWLRRDTGGANFLQDLERVRTWDEDVKRDLVTLTSEDDSNAISAWFTPKLVSAYHYVFEPLREPIQLEGGYVYDYEDSTFVKSVNSGLTLLATIGASLLPSLVILWLFHVKRTVVRIWITVGCTAVIGILLKILTNASMKEIFGGTAAFAAIEVVFIGSANGTYAGT